MSRRRPPEQLAPIGEANVLPVMNIMFLLIPALLLAMEVASMAAIAISPPQFRQDQSDPAEPPKTEELKLSVMILGDGFRVSSAAQQQGSEAGRALDQSAPTIPLAKPSAPQTDFDRYDYVGLQDLAQDYKRRYPGETIVRISAENDISAQVLINTLDALRGPDCKLGGPRAEAEPEDCLFFPPVVEAGPG